MVTLTTPIVPHRRCTLGCYGVPGYWHRNTLQDVPPSAFPGCPPVRRRLVRVSVRLTRRDIYHGFDTAVNRPHGGRISGIDHPRVAVMPTHHAPAAHERGAGTRPIPAHNTLLNCQHTPFLYGIVAHVKHPQYFFRVSCRRKFPQGGVAPSASFTRPAVCLMVAHLFDASLIRILFDFTLSRFDFAGFRIMVR